MFRVRFTIIIKELILLVVGILVLTCWVSCSSKTYFKSIRVEEDIEFYKKEGIPIEKGKCFAKSWIKDIYSKKEEVVKVYTGNDFSQKGLQLRTYLVRPKRKEWILEYLDGGGYPKNYKSGFYWMLTYKKELIGEFYEVLDTVQIPDFQYEKIIFQELKEEGHQEWREVICKEFLTNEFILKIQRKLDDLGYWRDVEMDGKASKET
ncbi:MAG: hypothetical protein AAGA77_23810, partial [Bacteroidota bacterium]